MLVGSYPMSVDAKARVTLPASFRKQLVSDESKTIMLVPFNGCVNGFTPQGFEQWLNGLFEYGDNHYDPRNRNDVRLRTGLLAIATSVDVDSAGRVALGKLENGRNAGVLEKMGLTGDVTVNGADDHFEVWNSEKWNEEQKGFEDDLDALMFRS